MTITEEYYTANMNSIEERYINLANELADQLLECMDWNCEAKEVNAQLVTALWLKCNEIRTIEEE